VSENSLITLEDRPVTLYSVRGLDFDAIEKKLDEEAESFGRFPGDGLTFDGKRGKWRWGYGKKGVPFDHNTVSFVFNLPNAVEGWQKFVDDRPVYGPMVYICDPTNSLPARETLGDMNKELWKKDERGNPMDPWKKYVAAPIRLDGDEKVNHIFISTFWGVIAFKDLMKDFARGGRRNLGKLPIVNISSEVKERKDAKGETFDKPVFDIVAWEFPTLADDPSAAEQTAASQTAIPEAEVNVTERKPATVVQQLQDQANATAAAEAKATEQTVANVAANAGARRQSASSGTQARPNGLFAGAPGRQAGRRVELVK
jgi:hypothetical protein